MPDDQGALDLLGRTGPLAVSSANTTGQPAATDADAAEEMLGWAVEVILDGGPSSGTLASTIVDCTSSRPRILREGAISADELGPVLEGLGTLLEQVPEPEQEPEPEPEPEAEPDPEPEVGPGRA
jgi:tRNA A37 threonylcarbamoyladenosine synthetase subunit TsaC/SUA5/YrdC